MQLTKSKWRNDPLKFFLFSVPGCPSSEFTKVQIKNRGLWGQISKSSHRKINTRAKFTTLKHPAPLKVKIERRRLAIRNGRRA